MTNRRFTVLTFAAVALATFLAPADASAQSVWDRIRDRAEQEQRNDDYGRNRRDRDDDRYGRNGRMSDYERRQLRDLSRRIDDRSRDLQRNIDRLLDNSRVNGTNREDRINNEARESTAIAAREHAAAREIGANLERLGLEADAARISAANADATCLAAREAVAECDERPAEDPSSFLVPPVPVPGGVPRLDDDEMLGHALEAGGEPRIFRLLRGDRQAMTSLVAALAEGSDPDGRRRWQLLLTSLIEAIVADAIEASALDFPAGHEFWGTFTRMQGRDIANALSSLGYRFDGLGGWADGRQPSQRDLSLALGYAGIDPMRVRQWPSEGGTTELFRDVSVAADEYLAGIAGDLTLAEMVGMLGRRADGLAEVWNHWGTIRPLLLEEG